MADIHTLPVIVCRPRTVYLMQLQLLRANLRGANLRRANLEEVPIIKNIHKKVYEAASKTGCLNMGAWHSCETTHCRAGWVVTLAGEKGKELETRIGTPAAAALIYWKSDKKLKQLPNFYASNADALEDMKNMAGVE